MRDVKKRIVWMGKKQGFPRRNHHSNRSVYKLYFVHLKSPNFFLRDDSKVFGKFDSL